MFHASCSLFGVCVFLVAWRFVERCSQKCFDWNHDFQMELGKQFVMTISVALEYSCFRSFLCRKCVLQRGCE